MKVSSSFIQVLRNNHQFPVETDLIVWQEVKLFIVELVSLRK